jgi:hypothetical protein
MSSKADKRRARKAAKDAKRKQASTAVAPPGEKRPRPGPPVERDENAKIMFRLTLMDSGGQWGFDGLSEEHVGLLKAKCKGYENQTIKEFSSVASTKLIPFEKMCPEAQKRAQEIGLEAFDGLLEVRLGGKPRLWGILDGHCFYLVWWDPEHEVCPSATKHT